MTEQNKSEAEIKREEAIWNSIRRRNGNDFKNAIQKKPEVLRIPDLQEILKYAGHVKDDDIDQLKRYLLNYVDREAIKAQYDDNVVTYLMMAGFVPYLSKELGEKYKKLLNEAFPMKKQEDFTSLDSPEAQEYINMHRKMLSERFKREPESITISEIFSSTQVPTEIARELSQQYIQERKKIVAQSKNIALEQVEMKDVISANSYEEQCAIQPFFATPKTMPELGRSEELCTFGDQGRFTNWNVINFVKRNVDDIKRSDYRASATIHNDNRPIPQRQDLYGTSVTSLQVRQGDISIKNRYNHTVMGCDSTYDCEPDKIIPGLEIALITETVPFRGRVYLPTGYTLLNDRCFFQYEKHFEGVYFSKTHYLNNNQVVELKPLKIVDGLYFESASEILLYDRLGCTQLRDVLLEELKGHKIKFKTLDKKTGLRALVRIRKDKETGELIEEEVLKIKGSKMVGLHLRNVKKLPLNFLWEHSTLEELICENVEEIEGQSCRYMPKLKSISLPKVKALTENFLDGAPELESIYMPSLCYVNGYALRGVNGNGVSSEINPITVTAPFVYDQHHGFKKGFVLTKECSVAVHSDQLAQMLNIELYGKKITYETDDENNILHVYGDGQKVLSIKRTNQYYDHDEIEFLRLEQVTSIPENLWSIVGLKHADFPNARVIKKMPGCRYPKLLSDLNYMNIPQIEAPTWMFLDILFKGSKDATIHFNKDKWEENGTKFYKEFILLNGKELFAYDKKHQGLFHIVNEQIKSASAYEIKQTENELSIIINGIESLRFKDGQLTKINLHSVTSLKTDIIRDFPALEEVNLPNLTIISDHNFIRCPALKQVALPCLQQIGSNCFSDLDGLEELHLPDLKTAGDSCFCQLPCLKTVDLPNLVCVRNRSFCKIDALESCSLPALKTMGNFCFCEMPNVRELAFENLTTMGKYCLSDVDKCQHINVNKLYAFNTDSFCYCPMDTKIEMETANRYGKEFFGGMLFDVNTSAITAIRRGVANIVGALQDEIKYKKIEIQERDGARYLLADSEPVLREENGHITGLYLNNIKRLNSRISNLPYLREFEANNVIEMSSGMVNLPSLERVSMKSLRKCEYSFENLPKLKEMELDSLQFISSSFKKLDSIQELRLDNLKVVDGWASISQMPALEKITLNSVLQVDEASMRELPVLKSIHAPKLKQVKYKSLENAWFLDKTPQLERLDAPMLKDKLQLLRRHKNRRRILKNMQQKRDFLAHFKFLSTLSK